MENEQIDKINIFTEIERDINDCFKMDYANQMLNNNVEFIKWKNSMKKKYGNDAKMFKCSKDNLLFYNSYNDCKNNFYRINCPLCKRKICYFCSRFNGNLKFIGNCCLKRGIYCKFFYHGKVYISKYGGVDPPPAFNIKLFFIPFIYFQFFMTLCLKNFFLGLPMKNAEINYEDYYKTNHEKSYYIILFIYRIFFCYLPIPYILSDFIFHICLLLISIPFKGYPICYYCGLVYGGCDFSIKEVLDDIY